MELFVSLLPDNSFEGCFCLVVVDGPNPFDEKMSSTAASAADAGKKDMSEEKSIVPVAFVVLDGDNEFAHDGSPSLHVGELLLLLDGVMQPNPSVTDG